jgi:hypothetical protein
MHDCPCCGYATYKSAIFTEICGDCSYAGCEPFEDGCGELGYWDCEQAGSEYLPEPELSFMDDGLDMPSYGS